MIGRLSMYVTIAFGIVFATCAGLYCIGSVADRSDKNTARSTSDSPPETDEDRLIRTTKTDSPYAGEQIIKTFLKAPSQAKFSDRELLKQNGNYALVRMTVDAPNSFGVMLRQKWCALLYYVPPRGGTFKWHTTTGGWQCSDGFLDEDDLVRRELAVGWPGAADDYATIHPKTTRRSRVTR